MRRGCINPITRRRPEPSACTNASSFNGDWGSHLTTSTVDTTLPQGGLGVGRSRLDSDADTDAEADADEEGEVREGGDVGEEK